MLHRTLCVHKNSCNFVCITMNGDTTVRSPFRLPVTRAICKKHGRRWLATATTITDLIHSSSTSDPHKLLLVLSVSVRERKSFQLCRSSTGLARESGVYSSAAITSIRCRLCRHCPCRSRLPPVTAFAFFKTGQVIETWLGLAVS